MERKFGNKAQSTLEYIVVLTAIVAVIIYAAGHWIKPAAQKTIDDAGTAIDNAYKELPTVNQ